MPAELTHRSPAAAPVAAPPTVWRGTVPLGVSEAAGRTRFAVIAEAARVTLRLVHPGTRALAEHPMHFAEAVPESDASVWTVEIPGQWLGWAYSFTIDRRGKLLADLVDPWARLVRDGKSIVLRPDGPAVATRPPLDPKDAILYELHLRDFTRDQSCGVRSDWRGKFLGLSQTGTRLEGSTCSTGLDHILELGVNVVQLMPVHGFAMPYHPEYEWGYMPTDYFAPHAGYASSVEVDAPVREFKRLVSALHEQGLRVTLDVVFNHTAEKWPDRLRALMALAPRDFFRFKNDGAPWDGSNCGNEVRSESAAGRRLIVEACEHWVTEYGVDGFRFDLMGLIDRPTMQAVAASLHAIDPTILVYGEPWASGPTPIEINGKEKQRSQGWAVFNDELRDALRGDVFKPKEPGFLATGQSADRVKRGILGSITSFADSPLEAINYIECHDNHTLSDRLRLSAHPEQGFTEEQRRAMHIQGALILLTSQGIPFLHSGQEFGRSKALQDNTYNLGDQINNIRWHDKADLAHAFAFHRAAVRLRRDHPMFRLGDAALVKMAVRFLDDDLGLTLPPGVVAYQLDDPTGRDAWASALVLFNGAPTQAAVPLPDGAWRTAIFDGHSHPEPASAPRHEHSLTLPPHTGAVLFVAR